MQFYDVAHFAFRRRALAAASSSSRGLRHLQRCAELMTQSPRIILGGVARRTLTRLNLFRYYSLLLNNDLRGFLSLSPPPISPFSRALALPSAAATLARPEATPRKRWELFYSPWRYFADVFAGIFETPRDSLDRATTSSAIRSLLLRALFASANAGNLDYPRCKLKTLTTRSGLLGFVRLRSLFPSVRLIVILETVLLLYFIRFPFDAPVLKSRIPFSRGRVRVHPNAGNFKTKCHCRPWHCLQCASIARIMQWRNNSPRMDLLEVRIAVWKLSSIRRKVI